ncbi:protein MpNPF15 [Marchantia polymorpha subsp. ruderalis]
MELQLKNALDYRCSSPNASPELIIYRARDQGDCRPAVDYKQRTADKSLTGGWIPAINIFGTELLERIAGFGVTQNLITYLTGYMHLSLDFSANVVTTYVGASYMSFIVGGYVADTCLGRFWTLIFAILTEVIGLVLLTFTATFPSLRPPECTDEDELKGICRKADRWVMAAVMLGLSLVALGIGSIKSCVSAFGADQFDILDPLEKRRLPQYFNWFFFVVSSGGLMAVTLLVYMETRLGRGWGFGSLAIIMLLSLVLLVSGRKTYRYRNPTGSPLTHTLQVVVAAFRNRKFPHPSTEEFQKDVLFYVDDPQAYQQHYDKHKSNFLFRFLDKAPVVRKGAEGERRQGDWHVASVEKVEEVKRIFHLIPTMSTSFLYYTVLAQMLTFSVAQSATLDRRLGRAVEIPPATVGVFLHLTVLLVIPAYEALLKPAVRRRTDHETGLSMLQRIGVGLVLSVLAMVTAAVVERRRLAVVAALRLESQPGSRLPMTVFWLLPQYCLAGLGEVFAYVGHMEFFYTEAPKTMRTVGTGFFLLTLAMGYFASILLAHGLPRRRQRRALRRRQPPLHLHQRARLARRPQQAVAGARAPEAPVALLGLLARRARRRKGRPPSFFSGSGHGCGCGCLGVAIIWEPSRGRGGVDGGIGSRCVVEAGESTWRASGAQELDGTCCWG